MTQDEVIEMAREADGVFYVTSGNQTPTWYFPHSTIYDFAKLVAAKEREACALICERVFKRMCPEAQENEVGIEAEIIRARGEQA